MIYCQECGSANDRANPTCRVCGRALQTQRSTLQCSSCQQFVGIGAAFCSNCGASADDLALGSIADGGTPPNESAIETLFAERAPAAAVPVPVAPTVDADAFDLGAGLDLPEWLKRAAAETPSAEPTFAVGSKNAAHGAPIPMAREHEPAATAQRTAPELAATAAHRPTSTFESATSPNAGEPPLPPLPDGGLSSTMPSWLRPGTVSSQADATTQSSAPPDRPRSLIPSHSLADDPTDTSSFISESDLPEWLRQLAASEEAQAAEARRAEDIARAAATPVSVEPPASTATPPPVIDPLPTTAGSGAAGRWLSRRDAAGAAGSGRRTAFADLVEERGADQVAAAETDVPVTNQLVAAVPTPPTSAPATTLEPATPMPSTTAGGDARRWIVIGAMLGLIVLLLVYLVVTGSFG